ncbi:hypothetical protein [Paenibacillus eucommiae]|uniref:Uncharacterized protein n=1 Tax=Paenibacillus eucommiae TaxID=1355755 RepID=A0ABS4IRJ5_9BACL|nr:hypothetical protein [Paenibacillus eucommiae]MBP1990195.1 hypothetical protein [Paenibacillus eucommiae]
MYTLFLRGDVVVAVKKNATPEDLTPYSPMEYVTLGSLPEGLEGNVGKVTWDEETKTVTPLPPPPDPGPTLEDKIAVLEEENINLMLAITELYELMIGGN